MYDDFCSRFPYNETDDQLNAIADVMGDLNAAIPMDRLVCGDVGFGKPRLPCERPLRWHLPARRLR